MIVVMGLPGAGKTTVLQKAMEGIKGWRVVNYGDLMFEIASKEGLVKDRDEMRKLPAEKQRRIQGMVGDKLAGMSGRVILDTHCSVRTPLGYMPGLPYEQLRKLKVDYLVFVSAPPKDILGRRKRDKSRKRDVVGVAEIEADLAVNTAYLCAYSVLSGADVSIIVNADGKLEEAAGKLGEIIKSVGER
ncbi:MAG: adenylate kinase [Candidatus Micrarchaeia archaeon]